MRHDIKQKIAERERYGVEELRTKKRLEAAEQLDRLIVVANQVALDLRGKEGEREQLNANDTAYARLYWLRKQLGHVVADVGTGAPTAWRMKALTHEYGKLLDIESND